MATNPIEKRVIGLADVVDDIPRLIRMRFTHMRLQMDVLDARVETVEAKVDKLQTEMTALRTEIQALPRVLAEMLDERQRRGR